MIPSHALAAVALVIATATASAQPIAVPPRPAAAVGQPLRSAVSLLTDETVPSTTIALAAPGVEELASLQARMVSSKPTRHGRAQPLKIGYMRPVPAAALDTTALNWQPVAGGGSAARIAVSSDGAAGLRIGIALGRTDPRVSFRFTGVGRPDLVFGPFAADMVAASEVYWSPVLEGSGATVEIYAPAGVDPAAIVPAIPAVGHLFVAGAALRTAGSTLKWNIVNGIGTSGACEVDVKCEPPTAALTAAASGVTQIILNDSRYIYQCSATLLNDSTASGTPYLYTANHCLASDPSSSPRYTPAQMAATVNTYWFFDAVSCGSKATPPYVQVAGGVALLGRGDDFDWALVRMNAAPPAGADFAAWRAEPLPAASSLAVLHHPNGDLKKYSQGSLQQYTDYPDGSSFATMLYTLGVTEPGSSGSPLLTMNAQGGFYEVRGGLYGGASECSIPGGTDDYSRLDIALPRIADYLTPDAASATRVAPVVEFYNADLNDYFITADPTEINCLDTGCHTGWERTGLRFLAWTNGALAPSGTTPVCRFYVTPRYGDSHFYSADPAECARVATQFKDAWIEESPSLFYIKLPDAATGACPAGTQPVYRFLNVASPLHHRYTAEVDVRNCLDYGENPADPSTAVDLNCAVPGPGLWLQEGYGTPPASPVMCAPASLN